MEKIYNPLVSIVIPVYNGSNFMREAIDSALKQTYRNIEIIVVNDGSKDGGKTDEIAKAYGNRIRYILKENGGSSSALNTGIKNMYGEWFSWLSHDDLYMPDKIEKEIEYLIKHFTEDTEFYKNVLFSGGILIDAKGNKIKEEKKLDEEFKLINSLDKYHLLSETPLHFHSGCLIHKRVFEDLGLFREDLRLINDFDMWFRIYSSNYKICYVPELLTASRIHKSQISRNTVMFHQDIEEIDFYNNIFSWLKTNCPDCVECFIKHGEIAYSKTMVQIGDQAFNYAINKNPELKNSLMIKRIFFKNKAFLKMFLKKLYLRFVVDKK